MCRILENTNKNCFVKEMYKIGRNLEDECHESLMIRAIAANIRRRLKIKCLKKGLIRLSPPFIQGTYHISHVHFDLCCCATRRTFLSFAPTIPSSPCFELISHLPLLSAPFFNIHSPFLLFIHVKRSNIPRLSFIHFLIKIPFLLFGLSSIHRSSSIF